MTEHTNLSARKDALRMVPGILVSLVAFIAVLYFADLDEVVQTIRLADYRYLPLVILLFVGSIAARAVAWRTLLREQVSVGKAFLTLNEGYLLNNILPFRLGEFGRAFLLSRTAGFSFWEVISTIVVERVFDVGIMAGLLLSTLPFVIGAAWARSAAFGAALLVLVGFVVLYLVANNQGRVRQLVEKVTGRWPKIQTFGREKLDAIFSGLAALTSVVRFARVLVWLLVCWALNIGWYYLLLLAFLPQAAFLWVVFAVGAVSLGVALPSSPAYIGVFEAAIVGGLTLFSVDPSLALAFALTAHVIYLAGTSMLGVYALVRDGQSLGQIYRQVRRTPV